MRWLEHIYHPFIAYLPLIRDILFRPWRFMKNVVGATDEYAENLRRCSFFLASIYLIIQPYLLPERIGSDHSGGLAGSFEKEIFLLIIIVLFSAIFPLVERKNKRLTLDTFLNFVIPLLLVSIFVSTAVAMVAQLYLQHFGLSRAAIYGSCRGLFDYHCLAKLLPDKSTDLYVVSLTNSLIEGHLEALFFICYVVGLDPLRTRKHVPTRTRIGKVGCVTFIYLSVQLIVLHVNDLF